MGVQSILGTERGRTLTMDGFEILSVLSQGAPPCCSIFNNKE